MLRRALLPVALLAVAVSAVPATHAAAPARYVAPSGSGALFLITGHGWGHGVGMGQWGAEGYAIHGTSYEDILAAYYPGTTLSKTNVHTLRVLLAEGQSSLTVSSAKAIDVVDGDGAAHTFAAGSTKLTTPLPYPAPLTLSPTAGATLTLGNAYRGRLVISVAGGKLRAINAVPLQQYVQSVVPAEMSSSWKPDALEAQAVATRSYALANRRAGYPYDVATSGQSYLGVLTETPEGTAAVKATNGEVLTYNGKVATTVYSSSTGGVTQSASDAWGGGAPYLVSVKDPYDTVSPWHTWSVTFTGKELATALGLSGKPADATETRNSSQRAVKLDITMRSGSDASVGAGTVASALDLRSTFFGVGVLSLLAPSPNPAVASGTTVTLTGTVRGVKNVVLEQRPAGGAWSTLEQVTPAAKTGAISIDVTPTVTTDYRLATTVAAAAPIRVQVRT